MGVHFTITPGIENRLRAWDEMARREPPEKKISRPCITISREFGCQAYPLAEILHKRLNELAEGEEDWIVLDRLLLEKIATESGFAKTELEYVTQVNLARWLSDVSRAPRLYKIEFTIQQSSGAGPPRRDRHARHRRLSPSCRA